MHDLSEGVIQSLVELMFTFISANYKLDSTSGRNWLAVNRDLITKAVEGFSFFEGQPCLKFSASQASFKLSGTALQVCTNILEKSALMIFI